MNTIDILKAANHWRDDTMFLVPEEEPRALVIGLKEEEPS